MSPAESQSTEEVTIGCPHSENLRILTGIDRLLAAGAVDDSRLATLRTRIPELRSRYLSIMKAADLLMQQRLTPSDLSNVRSHNKRFQEATKDVADFVSQVMDRLVELGLNRDQADFTISEFVKRLMPVNWVGVGSPPPMIETALDAVINNPAFPDDVKAILGRPPEGSGAVKLVWRADAARDLSTSIWVLNKNSLAVGPAFQDPKLKGQSQLHAFELGKLICVNHGDDELVLRFRRLSIPSELRRLPDVPQLTDDDFTSVFGYAYYHYLFKKELLRAKGLGGLVEQWDNDPPHGILKAK